MTENLFSIFDPSSGYLGLSLGWVAVTVVLALPSSFWVTKSALQQGWSKSIAVLNMEVQSVLATPISSSLSLVVVGMFVFILMNNFMGLLPYVFTGSSHLVFTGVLSLSLWLGFTISYLLSNSSKFLAHLVPVGTPVPLVPFMVIIELISSMMRPFTLAVRLAANMIAGHLLLDLCASPMLSSDYASGCLFYSGLLLLSSLELGVAVIQAYVFTSLSALYLAEVNSPNLQ